MKKKWNDWMTKRKEAEQDKKELKKHLEQAKKELKLQIQERRQDKKKKNDEINQDFDQTRKSAQTAMPVKRQLQQSTPDDLDEPTSATMRLSRLRQSQTLANIEDQKEWKDPPQIGLKGEGATNYQAALLPENFHERVMALEMKIVQCVMNIDQADNVSKMSELMGLYSAAIEYYNRKFDEENQKYYVEKLENLNNQIRDIVDRQKRHLKRKEKEVDLMQSQKNIVVEDYFSQDKLEEGDQLSPILDQNQNQQRLMQSQRPVQKTSMLSYVERQHMQDVMQMNIHRQTKQAQQNLSKEVDQHGDLETHATTTLKTDLLIQEENLKKKLAARKNRQSKRSSSQDKIDDALNLQAQQKSDQHAQDKVNAQQEQEQNNSSSQQTSPTLLKTQSSPAPKKASTRTLGNRLGVSFLPQTNQLASSQRTRGQKVRLDQNHQDDTSSMNKSTTTNGGGLALRIVHCLGQIMETVEQQNDSLLSVGDELENLKRSVEDLNQNPDLQSKVSCTTKIIKALQSASGQSSFDSLQSPLTPMTPMTPQTPDDFQKPAGYDAYADKNSSRQFGIVNSASKNNNLMNSRRLKQELKNKYIDPMVYQIFDDTHLKFESLVKKRDSEIEECMDTFAETKQEAQQKIKKKYKLKLAVLEKQNKEDELAVEQAAQKAELQQQEKELADTNRANKLKIKEKYNMQSALITIDFKALQEALIGDSELTTKDKSKASIKLDDNLFEQAVSEEDEDDFDQVLPEEIKIEKELNDLSATKGKRHLLMRIESVEDNKNSLKESNEMVFSLGQSQQSNQ